MSRGRPRLMGKVKIVRVVIFATILLEFSHGNQVKYRCAHCRPKGLYKEVFAYITRSRTSDESDKITLNNGFFAQSKCEEEGNFAHPLGNCQKFLRCHSEASHPKIVDCRPGTTFDPFSRECEDELHARDCKSCNKPLGYKIAHERGKKFFYMCQDGAAYEFECIGGHDFNRHTRACGNAEAVIRPLDLDETYVPGSVSIRNKRGKKQRISTGLVYERKPGSDERSSYRRVL